MSTSARIVLSDGREFRGKLFGARGRRSGPLIISASATGYEKELTDAAHAGAIVLFTTPHIGNTGLNLAEAGVDSLAAAGVIARDPVSRSSSAHAAVELEEQMRQDGVVGICEVDTRAIVRHVRGRDMTATIVSEED